MHSTFGCTGSDPGVIQVHTLEIKEGSLHRARLTVHSPDSDPRFQEGRFTPCALHYSLCKLITWRSCRSVYTVFLTDPEFQEFISLLLVVQVQTLEIVQNSLHCVPD